MKRTIILTIAGIVACGGLLALTSCNVTRTVTTSSQYLQRGDTTVIIQSKTIESYDATKRLY